MAGDCTYKTHYANDDTFCPSKPSTDRARELAGETDSVGDLIGRGSVTCSPNFEVIDGLLYRKKLERGFIHYREVLEEDRWHGAICTFHRRRPGTRHLSLEDTYRSVAENYWWEGMYVQIRDYVLGCPECLERRNKRSEKGSGVGGHVSKTMASHGRDVLSKLRSQREAGLFCDITLQTDGRSYSAHRAVLAAVSEYFQEVFTEMDSTGGGRADVDLTGFSEASLLSLLDFSYSSTLCVRTEDLAEVSTMARHLGMWPAVDACSALQREQGEPPARCPSMVHPAGGFPPPSPGSPLEVQRERKRRRGGEGCPLRRYVDDGFSLTLQKSNESEGESPRRSPRRPPRSDLSGHNGLSLPLPLPLPLPLSPTHRMKLMDFKSPSCKRTPPPSRNTPSTPRSRNNNNNPPSSPRTHTRLLRSTPGAAQEVLRLLPRNESPPRGRRSHPASRPASTGRQRAGAVAPVRVKQQEEEEEEEEDHLRKLEKYRLMNVLGLQRTSLLPGPEELIGWRQKKRLRKLKVNNYSLIKRRNPRPQAPGLVFGGLPLSLPLCNPASVHFLNRVIKYEPEERISTEEVRLKRPRQARSFPPSDRSMRSQGAVPDLDMLRAVSGPVCVGRELRRSVRGGDGAQPQAPPPSRPTPLSKNARALTNTLVWIKPEPDDYAISAPPLPLPGYLGDTHTHNPPKAHPQHMNAMETVRTLRYNSGRPAVTKAKLKQSCVREARRALRKPREESRRAGSRQGTPGVMERGAGAWSNKSPDPVPPPLHSHPLYRAIKEEPADPLPVAGPFPQPPSPELGKRQSKPPVKLLDPGFLFSFCRPAGGPPMVGVKREEESVDICLTRSVSRGERFSSGGVQSRVLRARGRPSTLPGVKVKKEKEGRSVSRSRVQRQGPNAQQHNPPHLTSGTGPKAMRDIPKKQGKVPPPHRGAPPLSESVRRARLKQLRGPRSQAPRSSHACPQCHTSYRDCDALIMHRIRHIEGKHWPCPLCSKTFFRQRNVRNHIRTHDQKLYKCRSCMAAS